MLRRPPGGTFFPIWDARSPTKKQGHVYGTWGNRQRFGVVGKGREREASWIAYKDQRIELWAQMWPSSKMHNCGIFSPVSGGRKVCAFTCSGLRQVMSPLWAAVFSSAKGKKKDKSGGLLRGLNKSHGHQAPDTRKRPSPHSLSRRSPFDRPEPMLLGVLHILWALGLSRVRPRGLQPTSLLYPWDFSSKNTGVGCHFLLQEIFSIQGSNLHLPLCRQILYRWAT